MFLKNAVNLGRERSKLPAIVFIKAILRTTNQQFAIIHRQDCVCTFSAKLSTARHEFQLAVGHLKQAEILLPQDEAIAVFHRAAKVSSGPYFHGIQALTPAHHTRIRDKINAVIQIVR